MLPLLLKTSRFLFLLLAPYIPFYFVYIDIYIYIYIYRTVHRRRRGGGDMESSNCMGLMAVVAVSSSVALVALQAHKRLLSDFMKKVQLEIGTEGKRGGGGGRGKKKKVRFAADVIEPSSNNEEYRRRRARQEPMRQQQMNV